MQKLIIEAAINEQAPKSDNPNVPYTVDECVREAIASADAGAAIVHFHARDTDTGDMQEPGTAFYLEAMREIRRQRPSLLVYPTYGFAADPVERYSHVKALADDPGVRLNIATIDPGAVNMGALDPGGNQELSDFVFNVPHSHVRYVMGMARDYRFPFSFVIREPGHIRHALTYYEMGLVDGPLFFKICLNEDVPWGMPPSPSAIQAYLSVIPSGVPYIWMNYTYGASTWAMNLHAIATGGHVRTGIGDNPVEPDGSITTNAEKVARVVDIARQIGRETATPEEAVAIMRGNA
jgi:3-keto-5-aminohexanoate cleavage enzyme